MYFVFCQVLYFTCEIHASVVSVNVPINHGRGGTDMPPRRRPNSTVSATIFIPLEVHSRAMSYVKDVKQITRSFSLQQFINVAVQQWLAEYDAQQERIG